MTLRSVPLHLELQILSVALSLPSPVSCQMNLYALMAHHLRGKRPLVVAHRNPAERQIRCHGPTTSIYYVKVNLG